MSLEAIGTIGNFDFTILYDDFDRNRFLRSIIYTMSISSACIVISTTLGLWLALVYHSGRRIPRLLIGGFVAIFRNTPPLIQLYFFFFGVGAFFGGLFEGSLVISATTWAVIAISVYITAFNIESFRAAITGLPSGCFEAAHALALPRYLILFKITIPLTIRAVLPSLTNNLVELIKATSYAYTIAVPEILYVSSQIWADELNVVEMMIVMFVTYSALIGCLIYFMKSLEKKLALPGYGAS